MPQAPLVTSAVGQFSDMAAMADDVRCRGYRGQAVDAEAFRFLDRFGHELAAPCRPHNLSGFVDGGMSQTSASPISQRTTRSSQRRRWAALRFEACGGGSPGIVALRTIWTARHDLAAVLHTSNRFGRKA